MIRACLKMCQNMFEARFMLCLKPCFYQVWKYVNSMFEHMKTCKYNIYNHVYIMFEDRFTPSLITPLHNAWRHFIKHKMIHIIRFKGMITLSMRIFSDNVWGSKFKQFNNSRKDFTNIDKAWRFKIQTIQQRYQHIFGMRWGLVWTQKWHGR